MVNDESSRAQTQSPSISLITRKVVTAILIVATGLILNVVLSGVFAHMDGVFYAEDIAGRLPARSVKAIAAFKDNYTSVISDLDLRIKKALQEGNTSDIDRLIKLRETYQLELQKLTNPIIVSAFYENRSGYYFLVALVFVALAVFLVNPLHSGRLNRKSIFTFALIVYVGWMFTNWLRNFVFYDAGRTIFSYVNYDVGKLSFFYQEIRAGIIAILISILWHQWMAYYQEVLLKTANWEKQTMSPVQLSELAADVSGLFNKWQVASILITAAFLPWTIFYWINVMTYGDTRYIISAMVIHVYWAISWVLISAPLIHEYRKWSILKSARVARALDSAEGKDVIEFLDGLNPLSEFQILFAAVASVVSFLFPLIGLIKGF